MEKWHAAKPEVDRERPRVAAREEARRASAAAQAPPQYTEVFGRALVEEARRDQRVIGITAAMAGGTGLSLLAARGARPVLRRGHRRAARRAVRGRARARGHEAGGGDLLAPSSSAAYDQIVHDVCLQKLERHASAWTAPGLVGDDGPTHHGSYDISYLRALPNIVVMAPRDEAHARPHAAHRDRARRPGRDALSARRRGRRAAARRAPRTIRDRHAARSSSRASGWRWSATAPACRSRSTPPPCCASAGVDPTVCDARFAKPLDRELLHSLAASPRAARDRRGERARRRLRLGGAGAALRLGTLAGGPARDPLRPPRPLRDPRQARPAARGDRPHRRSGSRNGCSARSTAARRYATPEHEPQAA